MELSTGTKLRKKGKDALRFCGLSAPLDNGLRVSLTEGDRHNNPASNSAVKREEMLTYLKKIEGDMNFFLRQYLEAKGTKYEKELRAGYSLNDLSLQDNELRNYLEIRDNAVDDMYISLTSGDDVQVIRNRVYALFMQMVAVISLAYPDYKFEVDDYSDYVINDD